MTSNVWELDSCVVLHYVNDFKGVTLCMAMGVKITGILNFLAISKFGNLMKET